jgi:hypothetical protein
MVLPMDRDMLLTPNERSMIGFVDNDVPVVKEFKISQIPTTLAICGVLERGRPRPTTRPTTRATTAPAPATVEQRFGFVALSDGRAVYVDQHTLLSDKQPTTMNLATIGVLNDKRWVWHNGQRTISFEGGQRTFVAEQAAQDTPVEIKSRWVNIDDKLGIGVFGSQKQLYDPHPTRAAGRLEQLFHLNVIQQEKLNAAKSGDTIAGTALVFYPGQNAQLTRTSVSKCDYADGVFTLEDGTRIRFDLSGLSISIERAK